MMTFRILIFVMVLVNLAHSQNNTVLFVMSNADTLALNNGEKHRQTGVFLNEFYLAYKSVFEAGYKVDFATLESLLRQNA